jgi:pyoverdine/dityrosine biosynthesis protein Dit1
MTIALVRCDVWAKVLGTMPDLGETLAVQRLDDFCEAVQKVRWAWCAGNTFAVAS